MDVLGDRLEQMLNRIVEARRKSEWLPKPSRQRKTLVETRVEWLRGQDLNL
jgi:hypothetical protein